MQFRNVMIRRVPFGILCMVLCMVVRAWGGQEVVTFAVACGYPPYQFRSEANDPVGLDVDVIRLVCERMGVQSRIVQGPWEDMMIALRVGKVDCVGGMEINEKRLRIFDFTSRYYNRRSAVFTLRENRFIQSLEDLKGMVIAGDRHSYAEEILYQKGIKHRIRIRHTQSKEVSLRLLKEGEVVAMVAPVAVAHYLAEQHGVSLRIIDNSDPGSPVGLAVRKGNSKLLERLNSILTDLLADDTVDMVLAKWKIQ